MIEQGDFARQLRGNPTDAERTLWRQLRLRQLNGHKFRRQHAVGAYIVDFACVERKLAVELDGSQHAKMINYDATRTIALEAQGYRVLRFWNNDVFGNMNGILTVILAALEATHPSQPLSRMTPPTLTLPPKPTGGGDNAG